MEWIKIKVKHYLMTGLTEHQVGALVSYQLLIAHLEREPSNKEVERCLGKWTASNLEKYARKLKVSCKEIARKVQEDVNKYNKHKQHAKDKMASWREKSQDVTSNVTSNVTSKDKIREDKRREDKIDTVATPSPQQEFMKSWGSLYEAETGNPYKADQKDFILVAGLIKKYSLQTVNYKAKVLFQMCKDCSAWFAKEGMSDFTIGKLSSMWNSLIPIKKVLTKTDKIIDAAKDDLRRIQENDNARSLP